MSAVQPIPDAVSITTHGRLHLGFYNLSQGLPRQFGSVGVAIDAFQTRLTVRHGPQHAPLSPWVAAIVARQLAAMQWTGAVQVEIAAEVPRHSGLGSGTQMAVALGAALQRLVGQAQTAAQIAALHQRGARSGIGIATFAHGGLVVDAGRAADTEIPPMIARAALPADWHVCLVMDEGLDGLHGSVEKSAFQQLVPPSIAASQSMQAAVLAQGLPAILEQDFATFSAFIAQLQQYNASYFAPAQGGAYASPRVAQVLAECQAWGHVGLGQTSWGPTGFIWLPSRADAETLCGQLRNRFADQPLLTFKVSAPINHGAEIQQC